MAKWNRRDYQMVCDVLTETIEVDSKREEVAREFASTFDEDNDLFDRDRFYEACEV